MLALNWLTARPVAHRGLHDAKAGIIENNEMQTAAPHSLKSSSVPLRGRSLRLRQIGAMQ